MLTGSFFMLEVYDRVLPSRSVSDAGRPCCCSPAGLFAALGILDLIRGRILVRIGNSLDEALSGRVYDAIVRLPLITGNRGDGIQPLRDLDAVRVVPVGPRADRVVRSALDADLSRDLLRVPSLDRADRAGRRRRAGRAHAGDRDDDAPARQGRGRPCAQPQPARGSEPPQCRGDHRHGHDRAHGQALDADQPAIRDGQPGGERRRRRPRRDLQGAAHDAAVDAARGRRLAGDQPAGDRRHHHRRARSSARARWRRSISRSPTGRPSSPRARAGSG